MFSLINDPRKLNGLIIRAITSGAKFGVLVHEAGYNCLMTVENTHDVRPLQRLYHGLSPNAKIALRVWAVKFGAVRYSTKSDAFSWDKKATTDVDAIQSIGPMTYRKEIAPKTAHVFNLKAEIEKLVKRADKHNANGSAVALLNKAAQAA